MSGRSNCRFIFLLPTDQKPQKFLIISQKYTDIQSNNIRSSANVTIHKGDTLQVKITDDDAAKVKVNQSGFELAIEYGDVVSSDGSQSILNNIAVCSNLTIGNIQQNNTVISGKSKVEIEIWCSDGLAINCGLDGMAVLNATPRFDCARIFIDYSGRTRLQTKTARLNVSGSGKIEYK